MYERVDRFKRGEIYRCKRGESVHSLCKRGYIKNQSKSGYICINMHRGGHLFRRPRGC